jgi:hypothetical protein
MIDYSEKELIEIGRRRERGEINRWSFCSTCSNSNHCNIQDTVCLSVAKEHPLSLMFKNLQTVYNYEPL